MLPVGGKWPGQSNGTTATGRLQWTMGPGHPRPPMPESGHRGGPAVAVPHRDTERERERGFTATGCRHVAAPTTVARRHQHSRHCHVGGGRRRRSNGDGGGHEDETHQNSEEGELMTQDDNEKTRRRGDGHEDGTQENPETKRRADKGDSTAIRYASGGHEERLPN